MKQRELIFPEGKIRFDLPEHWVFEAEEPGLFMYYDPRKDAGTLRLHVIAAKKEGVNAEGVKDWLENRAKEGSGRFTRLENGNFMVSNSKNSQEEGRDIVLYFWSLAKLSPPFLVECEFSFTIQADQQEDKVIQSEIAMLEKTIKEAVITLE